MSSDLSSNFISSSIPLQVVYPRDVRPGDCVQVHIDEPLKYVTEVDINYYRVVISFERSAIVKHPKECVIIKRRDELI